MSWRRSLSFSSDEEDLKDDYDNNGGSKYAKESMKFFKKYKDKIIIVNDNVNLGFNPALNFNTCFTNLDKRNNTNQEIISKASKLIKK